jgi:hypothetical protein
MVYAADARLYVLDHLGAGLFELRNTFAEGAVEVLGKLQLPPCAPGLCKQAP